MINSAYDRVWWITALNEKAITSRYYRDLRARCSFKSCVMADGWLDDNGARRAYKRSCKGEGSYAIAQLFGCSIEAVERAIELYSLYGYELEAL